MKGTVRIIPSGWRDYSVDLIYPPELKVLQSIIDGYIELIPFFDTIEIDGEVRRCIAYCSETGKLENKPKNEKATQLWRTAAQVRKGIELSDYLVGDVIILYGDDEFMNKL